MKINVEFDLTPQEFRQAMGLPDVEAFQKDLMARIQQQMEAGVEGYDPVSLLQPFLQQPFFKEGFQQPLLKEGMAQGLASFGTYQQMMLDMLRQVSTANRQPDTSATADDKGKAKDARGRSGTVSASSRAKRQ